MKCKKSYNPTKWWEYERVGEWGVGKENNPLTNQQTGYHYIYTFLFFYTLVHQTYNCCLFPLIDEKH
jgi:hypothetical protein